MPDRRDPEGDDAYLELREEWGSPQPAAPPPAAPPPDSPGDAAGPRPPDPTVPPPAHPGGVAASVASAPEQPTYVKGTARNVVVREHDFYGHVLEFRVDRYDASGNRAVPVPVRMIHHRDGQVADGDEVELQGQWKHGTLETGLIQNRTTGAQVHGGPQGCALATKKGAIGCGAVLLVGFLLLVLAGLVPFIAVNRDVKMVTVPDVVGQNTVDAIGQMQAADLKYDTRSEPSDEDFATVIRTQPAAGTRVKAGTRVVIVSSSGRRP